MIKKIPITVTVSKDLVEWIDKEIADTARFASRSHAIEYTLRTLRNEVKGNQTYR